MAEVPDSQTIRLLERAHSPSGRILKIVGDIKASRESARRDIEITQNGCLHNVVLEGVDSLRGTIRVCWHCGYQESQPIRYPADGDESAVRLGSYACLKDDRTREVYVVNKSTARSHAHRFEV